MVLNKSKKKHRVKLPFYSHFLPNLFTLCFSFLYDLTLFARWPFFVQEKRLVHEQICAHWKYNLKKDKSFN